MVFGIKDEKSEIQSIRFKSSKWTVKRAKKWLKKHKFKTSIEAAEKKEKHWQEELLEVWSGKIAEVVIKKIKKRKG